MTDGGAAHRIPVRGPSVSYPPINAIFRQRCTICQ